MATITTFFRHQHGSAGADESVHHTYIPVKAPHAVSATVLTDDTGRMVAASHSFKDLKQYDFWLQIQLGAFWVDLPETFPYTLFDPSDVKGHNVPQGATAHKVYRLTRLPRNTPVRAITTRLEGTKNGRKSGSWGVSITTGAEPRPEPPKPTVSPFLIWDA